LVDAGAHKLGYRGLGRLDVIAPAGDGDKLGAFDLRLALGAGEAMPAALALTGLRIAHVNNDCPTAGRPLTDMPLHFDPAR
jgi:hypothetical protein